MNALEAYRYLPNRRQLAGFSSDGAAIRLIAHPMMSDYAGFYCPRNCPHMGAWVSASHKTGRLVKAGRVRKRCPRAFSG